MNVVEKHGTDDEIGREVPSGKNMLQRNVNDNVDCKRCRVFKAESGIVRPVELSSQVMRSWAYVLPSPDVVFLRNCARLVA